MALTLTRYWLVLLGGILLGGGLVLHGQIAMANYMRGQAQGTFFLWRGIGKLTFMFQDEVTKAALALDEIPASVLREADRTAWVLVVLGGLVALSAPLVQRHKKQSKIKR